MIAYPSDPNRKRRDLLFGIAAAATGINGVDVQAAPTVHSAEVSNRGDPRVCRPINQVHQILLVDGFGMPSTLPRAISQRIKLLRNLYSDSSYTLWTGAALRAFIKQSFSAEVLRAFDYLKPYAYKSDLARLCLLYFHGGLYSDILLNHHAPLRVPAAFNLVAFRQAWVFRPYTAGVSNSLIWSEPGSPEMRIAIERIVEHCRMRFYGQDCVEPTGPWLFGRACAAAATDRWRLNKPDDQWMGVHSANGQMDDMVFHTPGLDHQMIATRPARKRGDWAAAKLAGTNDYVKMWEARDIYAS